MKTLLLVAAVMVVSLPAVAVDTVKPIRTDAPPPPDLAVIRQGGDTIADAIPIVLPYDGSGTTTGYTNDYDEICPVPGFDAPDVVYSLAPESTAPVIVDLHGSGYDTKVYIYDENLDVVACNDDFYSDYTSRVEALLAAGATYFIVIDGYAGDFGDYLIRACAFEPWPDDCPDGAQIEGEPPMHDDYVDEFNGGCATGNQGPVQPITAPVFCGVAGWSGGVSWQKNFDYLAATMPASGELMVTIAAEIHTVVFQYHPTDCIDGAPVLGTSCDSCDDTEMTIVGEPGEEIWIVVAPFVYQPPGWFDGNEYRYRLEMNLAPVANHDRNMSNVRGLFR